MSVNDIKDYLRGSPEGGGGVTDFNSWRFWLVLAAYTAAGILLMHDRFFLEYGRFQLRQGWLPMLLGVVVVAACCWEMLIFGKPSGANLLLQFFMLLPMTLFVMRVLGDPVAQPEAEAGFFKWAHDAFDTLKAYLPGKGVLGFVLVMVALCFKKPELRASMLVLALLIPLLLVIRGGDLSECCFLLEGTLVMCVGMALHYSRYDKLVYYENIHRRLRKVGTLDAALTGVVAEIMAALEGNGGASRQVSEGKLTSIVRNHYGRYSSGGEAFTERELSAIVHEISRWMVVDCQLTSVKWVRDGIYMAPEKSLFMPDALPLAYIAKLPKLVFIVVFVMLYMLLPVDLIPDGLPLVGYLDDTALAVFSGWLIKDAVDDLK